MKHTPHHASIVQVRAREILDSRGWPTVEVDVRLDNGVMGCACVPSGASTGQYEACEKRDGDKARYLGKGVLTAVRHVHEMIAPALEGMAIDEQASIDGLLCALDGSAQKEQLGANALLGVSLACLRAASQNAHMSLYRYIGGVCAYHLPVPLVNVVNGGCHADNPLDVQEFMLVPWNAPSLTEAVRWSAECFHHIRMLLQEKGLATSVGDEGGFAPALENTRDVLDTLSHAIEKAGYRLGDDIAFALDVAANECYKDGLYHIDGTPYDKAQLVQWYQTLCKDYPLVSIEDPFSDDDVEGWIALTSAMQGQNIQLVGDDLFVTNSQRLQQGIDKQCANAILIKVNQIGTISETEQTLHLAQQHHYRRVMSHRSGETTDTTIADLAVGFQCQQIKTGSMARGERLAKYNRLLRIEEELGDHAIYQGKKAFFP